MKKDIIAKFNHSTFLITGATGMIGQNVVKCLMDLNEQHPVDIRVIACARNLDKLKKVFSKYISEEHFSYILGDIVNLEVEEDVDYIIHTAGVTGGSRKHIDMPLNTINVAIDGTRRVLDLAAEKKCKGLVYLSTLEVYGKNPDDLDSIDEQCYGVIDPVAVRSSYTESKRMCENICVAYTKQFGVPTYIARLTATFGNGVDYNDNRVFAQFAKSIINKENIVLKSTGKTVRNYCDATDAAMAFLYMLSFGKPGEAYNVANMSTQISIKDLAMKFISLFPESGAELLFDLSENPETLGYNKEMRNVLNARKLEELGWKPQSNLDDMIRKLVGSMRRDKFERGI